MRLALAAAVFSLVAVPALAQAQNAAPPIPAAPDRLEAAARALDNPFVQEMVAAMADNLANVVLDTRVGPLAHYADPAVHENDTLRDIQRRRDPDFEKQLHAGTRRAVAASGKLARDAVEMRAALNETAARLDAALAPLRQALTAK